MNTARLSSPQLFAMNAASRESAVSNDPSLLRSGSRHRISATHVTMMTMRYPPKNSRM
jgi:hypothetical protein